MHRRDPKNMKAQNFYRKHGAENLNEHWLFWKDISVAAKQLLIILSTQVLLNRLDHRRLSHLFHCQNIRSLCIQLFRAVILL